MKSDQLQSPNSLLASGAILFDERTTFVSSATLKVTVTIFAGLRFYSTKTTAITHTWTLPATLESLRLLQLQDMRYVNYGFLN